MVSGLEQPVSEPPSTWQTNELPASVELNANVGVASPVGPVGPLSIVVLGAVVSLSS